MRNSFKRAASAAIAAFRTPPPPPPSSPPRRAGRNFQAAQPSRLSPDWLTSGRAIDAYLRQGLPALVARSRSLARNNDYMKQFLRQVRRNIVGPRGISLQVKAREDNGRLDTGANGVIERSFAEWSKKGNCTVCGRMSWLELQWVCSQAVARDGEILIRLVRGFPNKWGFALQLLETDCLDVMYNRALPDGGEIRMGVEMNAWGRPVAYWVLTRHPGLDGMWNGAVRHERVPAAEIIHLGIPEYPGSTQTRFMPWGHTAMIRLQMLGGYEEAALAAARAGASKMGFYQDKEPDAYGSSEDHPVDADGDLIADSEPGHFERLPYNVEFKDYDPTYPHGEMQPFMKIVLRGAAAGLGVSYNGLAGDLESVNYSSLRGGAQEERDEWQLLQQWMIGGMHGPIFEAWLSQSMLTGALALPFRKFDKFNAATWRPRGWDWVDPESDLQANAGQVGLGVKSRTQIAAEKGRDLEEVLLEIKAERELAAELGVDLADVTGLIKPLGKPPGVKEGA